MRSSFNRNKPPFILMKGHFLLIGLCAWGILTLGLLMMPLASAQAATLPSPLLVNPQAGKHIYDTSGHLSPSDITNLEQHAQKLVQAGAQPVVYLQTKAVANTGETRQDALTLAQSWHLGTNAIIIFINFDPANSQKGSAVLVAGSKYATSSVLGSGEDQNIYNTQMLPQFRQGHFASGIAAGLDAAYNRITASPAQQTAFGIGACLSLLLVLGLLGWGGYTAIQVRRPLAASYSRHPANEMPDDLPASLVGALIHGTAREKDVRVSLLEMAGAGALAIEPISDRAVQIRLQDKSLVAGPWQLLAYESLEAQADAQRIVAAAGLQQAAQSWSPIYDIIDAELRQRSLAQTSDDPHAATPPPISAQLIVGVGAGIALLGLVAIALPLLKNIWFGLFAAGLAVVIWGVGKIMRQRFVEEQRQHLPARLTALGASACAAWQAYAQRVAQHQIASVDPTRLTVYAPALDQESAVLPWLITSARMGFIPTWLSQGLERAHQANIALSPFYVYWLACLQGYVDPALITPAPEPGQSVTPADLLQPVAGINPIAYTALPFLFPMPLPIFIEEPVYVGGDGPNYSDQGNNDWGSGGGGFDAGGGGGGDWSSGGGDFGGGDGGGGDGGGGSF